jgi:hypothetical protein
VPLGGEKPKKPSLLDLLRKTVELPFHHISRKKEEQ